MKKIISFVLSVVMLLSVFGGLSVVSYAAEPEFDEDNILASFGIAADTLSDYDSSKPIKLLMIGNSFSQNVYNQILKVAESTGVNLICENVYKGGCSLQQHWDAIQKKSACYDLYRSWDTTIWGTGTVDMALNAYDWDYISIQQVSGLSGIYSTYQPYMDNIINYIRQKNPNAEIIFHQTWAYQKTSDHSDFPKYDKDQDKMWNAIEGASKTAAEHASLRIIPNGKAFQNARATAIGDNLNSDGYHANTMGEYLAAMTFLSTITGISADKVSYIPSGVSKENAALLKTAAKEAVYEYGSISYQKRNNPYIEVLDKLISKTANKKMDAMMIAGNVLKNMDAGSEINQINLDYIGEGKTMFTLGETDKSLSSKIGFMYISLLANCYKNDTEKSAIKRECNRHFVSNGIHILGITYSSIESGVPSYSDTALSWLDTELKAATEDTPDTPIFVVTSYPVTKEDKTPLNEELFKILAKYKNIINVCGGTEKSAVTMPVIYNDKFISINAGTLDDESETGKQISLAEVDINGNVKLTIINLADDSETEIILPKAQEPEYEKGDFDFDGEITVADALAALRIAAKLVPEDDIYVAIGDVDGDNHVTVADALAILRVAAKLVNSLSGDN